eukprot:356080-Chlamydomonas_euryale.AAC.4
MDIIEEDSNGAASVDEKSPPRFCFVGTSAPGRELTGQASILSFTRQLTRQEKREMQLGASSLLRGCLEQVRKPGRPPKALTLAAAGQVTVHAPLPELHAHSQPRPSATLSRYRVLALAARQLGGCAYSSRWGSKCVANHADGRNTCESYITCSGHCRHGEACTSHAGSPRRGYPCQHLLGTPVSRPEIQLVVPVSRLGASHGTTCAEGQLKQARGRPEEVAKAASMARA